MLIPVRCFHCNKLLGNKWVYYQKRLKEEKGDAFDAKVDKLVAQYNKIESNFLTERDSKFRPIKDKLLGYEATLEKYEAKMKGAKGLTENENNNYVILKKKYETKRKELDRSANRLDRYTRRMDTIKLMPEFAFFPRGVV
jgi:chromosome segregation ATPase